MMKFTPTEAQLREAWANRKRTDWPRTFEACIDHAVYSRIIRIETLSRELFRQRRIVSVLGTDFKSRAAGERLDKDKDDVS